MPSLLARHRLGYRRLAAGALAGVVAASVVAACGSSTKSSSDATPDATAAAASSVPAPGPGGSFGTPETTKITVPLVASSAAEGFYVYAAKEGIYGKYGLTVNAPNSDAGQLKASFIAGNAQIAELSGSDLVNVYAKGFPVEVIGCNYSAPSTSKAAFQVYARGGVTAVSGLKGKTIGTTSLGSSHEIATENFLAQSGLNPSDVKFVPLGSVPNILAALQSGRIDAGALSFPFYAKAANDKGLHDLGGAASPAIETVVNANWAKKNPKTIVAFLEGNLEGLAAYSTQQSKALPVLASFLGDDLGNATQAASVKAGYQLYLPPNTVPIKTCNASVLNQFLPYLPPSEKTAAKKVGAIFDNSYLNQIAASGFYAKVKTEYGTVPGFPAS